MGQRSSIEKHSPASKSFWKSENKKELGTKGEGFVASSLVAQGYVVLRKNWRTPFCEIDLVAAKGDRLLIVEVKTRAGQRRVKNNVRRLINFSQRQRLIRAALWIWQRERKNYQVFECRLANLTYRGINWTSLPLLYDRN